MCGIAGFTHQHSRPDPARIRACTATLHHRGPDQSGTWESDTVSLGAVRLKIIDLAHGDQPIVSQDGHTVIVFNGEIYNHAELRAELEREGHRFQTQCDTEVVLEAFRRWDTNAFKRLRGMFGVALWQEKNQRLVLARDRVGIKPLYLYQHAGDLYFGSELKAILEHPEIPRRLDRAGLAYYLSLNYVPAPFTLVEGVTKLAPGHWLEWRNGQTHTEQYWVHSLWSDKSITAEGAKEQLDHHLRESMREHLIADVPLGIWASGGLDSSTVLHYAAEQAGRQLKTFSVSFKGHKHDESAYFRQVSQHYGTDHHEFDLNPEQDLAGTIEQLVHYSDEPSADAGALPVWFLSKMSRQHVTVALSGEGADELFAGYNTYLADSYAARARQTPQLARRAALAALRWWPASDEKISFEYKVKRFLTGSLLDEQRAHLSWNGTHTDEERRRLYPHELRRSVQDLYRWLPAEFAQSGPLNRFLWLDQRFYLADDILYKCDRMSMAHSLEVRPPFLDHRLIEFANSLPEEFKIRDGSLKWILRDLMRDKLPPIVVTRPKEGFDIPAHQWFRGILKPLLLDTLSDRAVKETGLFDPAVLQHTIASHLKRRANLGYHLWGLLILFLWMKRWKIQTATP
jgi:asparagine synthase (glutamine-hydrolysing)